MGECLAHMLQMMCFMKYIDSKYFFLDDQSWRIWWQNVFRLPGNGHLRWHRLLGSDSKSSEHMQTGPYLFPFWWPGVQLQIRFLDLWWIPGKLFHTSECFPSSLSRFNHTFHLQVDLVNISQQMDLNQYTVNGGWDIIGTEAKRNVVYYACCQEPFPDVTYFLLLRRRTLYYIMNVVTPCLLLSGLSMLGKYHPQSWV